MSMAEHQSNKTAPNGDATAKRESTSRRDAPAPSENYSGRPTTVRFPTAVQKQLEAVAAITGRSISSLIREGVDLVIERHMGADPAAVIAKAAHETEARLRALYGLD
jgi:hypothetical protein